MNASSQRRVSDDMELEQKRAELAALRARHADARAVLQQLRDEIACFERNYERTLGRRMAELERIEAEISRLSGYANWDNLWTEENSMGEDNSSSAGDHSYRESSAAGNKGRVWKSEPQDIKALYREVAKTIHPDLVSAGPAQLVRHELMAKANRAYAEDDRRTLQDILRIWRSSPHLAEVDDAGAELARLDRQIARERQDLRSVNATIDELRASYVCRFKLRVDASLAAGSDLFADMIAAADLNIARALGRLAALQGETPQEPVKKREKQKRRLSFPAGLSCGTLYLRDRTSLDYSQWKKLGSANGCLEIDIDKAVRLDLKEQAGLNLSQLKLLKPDDLQSLFLYGFCDADLDSIVHLTGLEDLYLSGQRLTDAALRGISALTNLKRIYLYQTSISDRGLRYLQLLPGLRGITSSGNSITDEGLAGFEQAVPRVKTVSFRWKR